MTETDVFKGTLPSWFPDIGLSPSFIIRNAVSNTRPYTVQSLKSQEFEWDYEPVSAGSVSGTPTRLKKDWSLALFSVLVIAAAVMFVIREVNSRSAIPGTGIAGILPFILTAGAMVVSVAHLGRPGRAPRAILNLARSPLSREIAAVILLGSATLVSWLKPGLIPLPVMVALAVIAVISVDMVYFATDKSLSLRLHTGQAFFTAIYATTWFTEPRISFVILSLLASVSVVLRYSSSVNRKSQRTLYYFRAMALPGVFLLIYPGNPTTDMAAIVLFIAGIIADRLLFYLDFNPPDIKDTIKEHFNSIYEKERDKQRKDSGLP